MTDDLSLASTDEAIMVNADPPSPAANPEEAIQVTADPPSEAVSPDEAILVPTYPPSQAVTPEKEILVTAYPPSASRAVAPDQAILVTTDPPSQAATKKEEILVTADPPSPAVSSHEASIAAADPPSLAVSSHEASKAAADPPSQAVSPDEAIMAAADPPSQAVSPDEASMAAADPPSQAVSSHEASMAAADPLSQAVSPDEAIMAATDPPSQAVSSHEASMAAADPPSQAISPDEAIIAAADPPSPAVSPDESIMDAACPPTQAVSSHEASMAAEPPSSPPSMDGPVDAFTDPTLATDRTVKKSVDEVLQLLCSHESISQRGLVDSPPKREMGTENPVYKNDQQEGHFVFPFNQDILESLFAVCAAKDLANFRYVSKEWSEAGVKAWRKEAQVTIVDYQQGKPKPPREYFKKLLLLEELIRHINDSEDPLKLNFECYQFHKYKLERWYITNKNPNMVIFWGNLGPSITQLYLYDLRIDNLDTMLEILYEKVPNMKTLILEKLFVLRNEDRNPALAGKYSAWATHEKLSVLKVRKLGNFPVNWREFFGHFPGIKSLESVSITTDATLTAMLQAINSIRMERDVLKLKSLTIIRADKRHRCVEVRVSNELNDVLFALRDVQLEEFNVKLGCKTTIAGAKTILGTFADSLRKLTFHVDFKTRNQNHCFPYVINFPVLEELQLFQWCTPETKLHLLFKQMPNLRSVKVDGVRKIFGDSTNFYEKAIFAKEENNEANLVSAPGLGELSLSSAVCRSSVTLTQGCYLVNFAPNLTKLGLKMDDQIFRLVCKSYPNLIEIRVGGTDLTDAGVCGKDTRPKERNQNISDLKKLRVFVLESLTHDLTDVSVFNGFLKVPKLFTLQMSLPKLQISDEARRALEQGINNLVIMKWAEGKKKGKQQQGPIESSEVLTSDCGVDDVEEGDK